MPRSTAANINDTLVPFSVHTPHRLLPGQTLQLVSRIYLIMRGGKWHTKWLRGRAQDGHLANKKLKVLLWSSDGVKKRIFSESLDWSIWAAGLAHFAVVRSLLFYIPPPGFPFQILSGFRDEMQSNWAFISYRALECTWNPLWSCCHSQSYNNITLKTSQTVFCSTLCCIYTLWHQIWFQLIHLALQLAQRNRIIVWATTAH